MTTVRIAEPFSMPVPDRMIGTITTEEGWICEACNRAVVTAGPFIACPIAGVVATDRHNAFYHPRRFARARRGKVCTCWRLRRDGTHGRGCDFYVEIRA